MSEKFYKSFKRGDIVYWCHRSGHEFSVHWGMVDEQFSDAVIVDYLVPRERRLVNGIPIDKFESEYKYKKLPKGWSSKDKLFNTTYDPLSKEELEFKLKIDNPQSIKEAYEMGYLVKDNTVFHGRIEADITKEGFRIIKKYDYRDHHIDHVSIVSPKLYFKYDEAKKVVDENIAEFKRQASLTDYEWSVEKIDNILGRWKFLNGATNDDVEIYRNWILSLKNVEDVNVRIWQNSIQWKYWKNKRWNNIEL